jgi:hypothetical protein
MFDYFRTLHHLLRVVLLNFEAASRIEHSAALGFAGFDGVAVQWRTQEFFSGGEVFNKFS